MENIQRADLTPIEEAHAFQKLTDAGHTQTEIAKRIGKGQSYVAQKLRLLKMPEHLRMYMDGMLSEGHARQLMRLQGIYAGDDVTQTFKPGSSWRIESADDLKMLFLEIRPLEHPIATIKRAQAHAAMVEAFGRAVAANGWTLPAWQVAALHYAAVSVDRAWSVATLAGQINVFRDLLYSAVVSLHGRRHDQGDRRESLLYWSYYADLRHATHAAVDELPLSLLDAAYTWSAGNGTSLPYPSIVQVGEAVIADDGIRLARKEDRQAQIDTLDERLDNATTLNELNTIATVANSVQNEIAADRLRIEKAMAAIMATA